MFLKASKPFVILQTLLIILLFPIWLQKFQSRCIHTSFENKRWIFTQSKVFKLNIQFSRSGLDLIQKENITDNIIIALEKMSESRKASIRGEVPKLIRKVFESYAGVKGSSVHNSFLNGNLIYLSAMLKNPINT